MEVRRGMEMADVIALIITVSWCCLWFFASFGDSGMAQVWEKGTFVMTFILGYYFKRGSEVAFKVPLKLAKKLRRKEPLPDERERMESDI